MLFIPPLSFIQWSGAKQRNMALYRNKVGNFYHGRLHPAWPNIETTIRKQLAVRDSFEESEQLFCTGTSVGAYASILFGHYLRADVVHAFAPQTSIDMQTLGRQVRIPPRHQQLSSLLSDWNGRTRYLIYYSRDFETDSIAAEELGDCPGVELCPMPGKTHNVFAEIDAAELLAGLFPPQESTP